MVASENPGVLKKFRRTAWSFQQTFLTPTVRLQAFVSTIVETDQSRRQASLTIDQVVFEPKCLTAVLDRCSIRQRLMHGVTFHAQGREEISDVLFAALKDSVDFIFVPEPQRFAIYIDHHGDLLCSYSFKPERRGHASVTGRFRTGPELPEKTVI
jgi:hypothetical protein